METKFQKLVRLHKEGISPFQNVESLQALHSVYNNELKALINKLDDIEERVNEDDPQQVSQGMVELRKIEQERKAINSYYKELRRAILTTPKLRFPN